MDAEYTASFPSRDLSNKLYFSSRKRLFISIFIILVALCGLCLSLVSVYWLASIVNGACLCIIAVCSFVATVLLTIGFVLDSKAFFFVAVGIFYSTGFMMLVTIAVANSAYVDNVAPEYSMDWQKLAIGLSILYASFPVAAVGWLRSFNLSNVPAFLKCRSTIDKFQTLFLFHAFVIGLVGMVLQYVGWGVSSAASTPVNATSLNPAGTLVLYTLFFISYLYDSNEIRTLCSFYFGLDVTISMSYLLSVSDIQNSAKSLKKNTTLGPTPTYAPLGSDWNLYVVGQWMMCYGQLAFVLVLCISHVRFSMLTHVGGMKRFLKQRLRRRYISYRLFALAMGLLMCLGGMLLIILSNDKSKSTNFRSIWTMIIALFISLGWVCRCYHLSLFALATAITYSIPSLLAQSSDEFWIIPITYSVAPLHSQEGTPALCSAGTALQICSILVIGCAYIDIPWRAANAFSESTANKAIISWNTVFVVLSFVGCLTSSILAYYAWGSYKEGVQDNPSWKAGELMAQQNITAGLILGLLYLGAYLDASLIMDRVLSGSAATGAVFFLVISQLDDADPSVPSESPTSTPTPSDPQLPLNHLPQWIYFIIGVRLMSGSLFLMSALSIYRSTYKKCMNIDEVEMDPVCPCGNVLEDGSRSPLCGDAKMYHTPLLTSSSHAASNDKDQQFVDVRVF